LVIKNADGRVVERNLGTVAVTDAPPRNPLPLRRQLTAIRMFDSGPAALRDAGGHVTRLHLGPRWLVPPVVVATSPRAARDILSRSPEEMERNRVHDEMRDLLGSNLFDLQYRGWLPRRRALQPVFTKHNVHRFGGHMAEIAEAVTDRWSDGARIDLDTEARRVTLGALGRSVLGLDLQSHTDAVADPVRTAITYIADRGANPFRTPRWLPTPARRRARAASVALPQLAGDGEAARWRAFFRLSSLRQVILKPRCDRCVVGCRACVGPGRKRLARFKRDGSVVAVKFSDDVAVVLDIHDHGHVTMVLGCGPDHGGPPNVDILDRLFEGRLARHRFLERIEIAHEQVDPFDAVLLHRRCVALIIAQGEQAAVDLRMQGLEATVHHFRKAGHCRHVGDLQACRCECLGGSAGGDQFNATRCQCPGEFHEAGFVRNRNERPAHLPET
jgi:hypothetical protein